ncbi:hypothetical protein ALC57_05141, partial [Trachymyrmex cornetzi]
MENHERVKRELLEQCDQVATLVECFAWLQRCDEYIERLEELCRAKRRAVINYNHIEPHRFLEDAREIVLERMRDAVKRHGSVKVNTAFNGEFATKDKRANKSIITKNSEIYRCTDMRECTSLEKLASYLDKNKLQIVRSEFTTLSDEEFELLTRKGVFPYEYIDCVEKLQDTRLPPR